MNEPGERDTEARKRAMNVERDPLIERAAQLLKGDDTLSKRVERDKRSIRSPLERGQAEEKFAKVEADLTSSVAKKKIDESSLASSQQPEQPNTGDDGNSGSGGHDHFVISESRARRERILMPGTDQIRAVAEFREIKRSVLYSMYSNQDQPTKNPNLIMVTSARPNEGKTFVSINLAISLAAEKDISVLLVDVDHSRAGTQNTLGFSAKTGLIDLVADSSMTLDDVIHDTNIEGLSVIASGTFHPMGAELYSSSRMKRIVDELSREHRNRIVIFDCPPVLATTEASILAQHVGHVLFVVEASKTTKGNISDSLELLGHSQNLGFILNKTRAIVGDTNFGAYSGYGYGYGKPSENR